jgi:hypothetical protein
VAWAGEVYSCTGHVWCVGGVWVCLRVGRVPRQAVHRRVVASEATDLRQCCSVAVCGGSGGSGELWMFVLCFHIKPQ